MMRKLLICFCLIMNLCGFVAHAEQPEVDKVLQGIDVSPWQAELDASGADIDVGYMIRSLARGEGEFSTDDALGLMWDLLIDEARAVIPSVLVLLAPALLWALNKHILSDEHGLAGAAGHICYMVEAGALLSLFGQQVIAARDTIALVGRVTEQTFPILTGLLLATGGAHSATVMQPMGGLAGAFMSHVVQRASLVLCGSAAVLAVAGNMSGQIKLNGLYKLCRSISNWIMGVTMTGFLGIMTVSGMLGSTRDGVSIRTAKYTVDNLLPVIGGEVADTMDMMVGSTVLVKNAAGVTGMIVLMVVCIRPLLRVIMAMLACRLSAALAEPVEGGGISRLIDQFAGVMQMLLVAMTVAIVIFYVLVGAVLLSGNAIAMLR